jgi:uncharacterized protein YdaU (DUF1376 family)
MHYFKRNIGDYHKKAGRLSMLQHGAYTLLLDSCYDREEFPTKEQAIEWCWASTADEVEAVEFVLYKFFILHEGKYIQTRIMEEITRYQENSNTNKQIAIRREEARKTRKNEPITNRERTVNEPPPNQEPRTTNHKTDKDYMQKPSVTACPVEQIIRLYQETCTRLPRLRVIPDKTRNAISARWRQDVKFQSIEFWQGFFDYCNENKFLSGQSNPRPGSDRPFRADLNWVVNATNFANIINEKYA